ncbi:MAG: flagellar export chaperone FliS [Gammaproteobacteria bacterium]
MSYPKTNALNTYNQVAVQANATDASPHRLIQMLLEGALEKIAIAKGHMARGEIASKGRHIGWAISIISGLRASLDMEAGGEIAQNLEALYEYMERRMLHANQKNDATVLDEVSGLLREVKGAWDAIPEQVQRAHAQSKCGAVPERLAAGR